MKITEPIDNFASTGSVARPLSWGFTACLAAIFIFAGTSKLSDPATFQVAVMHFRIFPRWTVEPIVFLVPIVEGAAGLLCLSRRWSHLALQTLLLLTITYCLLLLSGWWRGISPDCNCFGPHSPQWPYSLLFARNAGLISCELWLLRENPFQKSRPPNLSVFNWELRSPIFRVLLPLFCLTSSASASTTSIDYSITPGRDDNFLEASFRFIPSTVASDSPVVLVFVPGTDGDGRNATENPELLKIAYACHASLLGCFFRGEGLPYDDPRGGSGRALDEALAFFGAKTGFHQLGQARLLLLGFSQGGMFAYNYVCWRPDRVAAFASLRSVFPRLQPQQNSFQVPGLLAAGELDQPGRIGSIASVFATAQGPASKWSLLYEKQSGHDIGRSLELAGCLFRSVTPAAEREAFLRVDTMKRDQNDPACDATHLSWFPSREMADLWRILDQPITLKSLVDLPDYPTLQDRLSLESSRSEFQCDNGSSQTSSVHLAAQAPGVKVGSISITGTGFSLVNAPSDSLPSEFEIRFAPVGMPWGEVAGELVVRGEVNGREAEDFHFTLFAQVKGPINPFPATVFFGVVGPGDIVNKTISLQTNQAAASQLDLVLPPEMTAIIDSPDRRGVRLLHLQWLAKRPGRMSGAIELRVSSPENGTLRIPVFGFVGLSGLHAADSSQEIPSQGGWKSGAEESDEVRPPQTTLRRTSKLSLVARTKRGLFISLGFPFFTVAPSFFLFQLRHSNQFLWGFWTCFNCLKQALKVLVWYVVEVLRVDGEIMTPRITSCVNVSLNP